MAPRGNVPRQAGHVFRPQGDVIADIFALFRITMDQAIQSVRPRDDGGIHTGRHGRSRLFRIRAQAPP